MIMMVFLVILVGVCEPRLGRRSPRPDVWSPLTPRLPQVLPEVPEKSAEDSCREVNID